MPRRRTDRACRLQQVGIDEGRSRRRRNVHGRRDASHIDVGRRAGGGRIDAAILGRFATPVQSANVLVGEAADVVPSTPKDAAPAPRRHIAGCALRRRLPGRGAVGARSRAGVEHLGVAVVVGNLLVRNPVVDPRHLADDVVQSPSRLSARHLFRRPVDALDQGQLAAAGLQELLEDDDCRFLESEVFALESFGNPVEKRKKEKISVSRVILVVAIAI